MEAIKFIKKYHKRYLLPVENIEDEYGLTYYDYENIYIDKNNFNNLEYEERQILNNSNISLINYIKKLINKSHITVFHNYQLLKNKKLFNLLINKNKQLIFNIFAERYLYNEKIKTSDNLLLEEFINYINNKFNINSKKEITELINEYLLKLKKENTQIIIKLLSNIKSNYLYKELINEKYNILDFILYNPNKEVNELFKKVLNYDSLFIISLTYSSISTYQISQYNLITIIKILKNKYDYLLIRYNENYEKYIELQNYFKNYNIKSKYQINEVLNYYIKIHYSIIFNNIYNIYLNFQPFYIIYNLELLNYSNDIQNYIMNIIWDMAIIIIKRLLIKLSIITQSDIISDVNIRKNKLKYKSDMKYNIIKIINNIIKQIDNDIFKNCIINDKIKIITKPYKPEITTKEIIKKIDKINISYNLTTLFSYIVNILKYKIDYNEFIMYMLTRKQQIIKEQNIINSIVLSNDLLIINDNYLNSYLEDKKIKYYNLNIIDIINKIKRNKVLEEYEIKYYYQQNPLHKQIYYFIKENSILYQIKENEIYIKFHNKYYNNKYVERENMKFFYYFIKQILTKINKSNNKYIFINNKNIEKMIKENIKKNINENINIILY